MEIKKKKNLTLSEIPIFTPDDLRGNEDQEILKKSPLTLEELKTKFQ